MPLLATCRVVQRMVDAERRRTDQVGGSAWAVQLAATGAALCWPCLLRILCHHRFNRHRPALPCLLQWRERALAAEAQLAGDSAADVAPGHPVAVAAGKAAAAEDSPGTTTKKAVEA